MGFSGKRKRTVGEALSIEVGELFRGSTDQLAKYGIALLLWGWRDSGGNETGAAHVLVQPNHCTFLYSFGPMGETPKPVEVCVKVKHTDCQFGGTRRWFACPLCGARCRKLYGGTRVHVEFACRECQELTYRSRQIGHAVMDWGRRAEREIVPLLVRYERARADWTKHRLNVRIERCRARIRAGHRAYLLRMGQIVGMESHVRAILSDCDDPYSF